jgi:hypothetical protein
LAVIPAIVSVGILTGLPRQSTRSAIKASYTHKWTVPPTHTKQRKAKKLSMKEKSNGTIRG